MTPCLFCKVVDGTQTATKVMEDESSVAFLDHRPLFKGHTLLVPRTHYETLADIPASLLMPLFHNAQRLSKAVVAALDDNA